MTTQTRPATKRRDTRPRKTTRRILPTEERQARNRRIRQLHRLGGGHMGSSELARMFGLSEPGIWAVLHKGPGALPRPTKEGTPTSCRCGNLKGPEQARCNLCEAERRVRAHNRQVERLAAQDPSAPRPGHLTIQDYLADIKGGLDGLMGWKPIPQEELLNG